MTTVLEGIKNGCACYTKPITPLKLDEYVKITKQLISKYGYFSLLYDEDAVAFITKKVIDANYNWDGRGNLHGYMCQCALWGILTWKKKLYMSNKNAPQSLNSSKFTESLPTTKLNPLSILCKQEESEEREKIVNDIFNNCKLTSKQKKYLHARYMDGKTLEEIGDENGVSRQCVEQAVNIAIEKVRAKYAVS